MNLNNIYNNNRFIYFFFFSIIIILYFPVLNYEFIDLDDYTAIVNNPFIKNGLNWESIKWSFTTTYYDYWHPLTWITHIIDWQLYGPNAGGHHLTNVLFHILNTIVLFKFLLILLKNRLKPFFISLLFAIHPMHVESIAWAVERKDVLSMFWGLLTLYYYLIFKNYNITKYYLFSIFIFILCLMTKPMFVTIPFILILIDLLINDTTVLNQINSITKIRVLILNKTPFIILSILSAIFTIITVKTEHTLKSFNDLSLLNRIYNSINTYSKLYENLLFPLKTSIIHPYIPFENFSNIIFQLIIVILVTTTIIITFKNCKITIIGLIWFFVTLLPVIGLIQTGSQSYADRFVYFPYIGLYISLITIIFYNKKYFKNKIIIVSIFTLYLSFVNRTQLAHWQNTETLFTRSLQIDDRSLIIHNNLGKYYLNKGNIDSAKYHFEKSVFYNNEFKLGLYNTGLIRLHNNKNEEAIKLFQKVINLDPYYFDAYISLAECALKINNDSLLNTSLDQSLEYLQKTTKRDYYLQYLLGKTYYYKNNLDSSIKYYELSLKQNPNQWESYNNIGTIYFNLKEYLKSSELYMKAISINKNALEPWKNILLITQIENDLQKTINLSTLAIELFPNEFSFYLSRAKAYHALNNFNLAKKDFIKAQMLNKNLVIKLEE